MHLIRHFNITMYGLPIVALLYLIKPLSTSFVFILHLIQVISILLLIFSLGFYNFVAICYIIFYSLLCLNIIFYYWRRGRKKRINNNNKKHPVCYNDLSYNKNFTSKHKKKRRYNLTITHILFLSFSWFNRSESIWKRKITN